jgi:putative flippase GtrA
MIKLLDSTLIGQILRFGAVGTIGFVIDAASLRFCLMALGLDFYSGRVISFLVAATATYILNRVWTFGGQGSGRTHRQLALWLALMSGSALINYGTYVLCLQLDPIIRQWPELAVAAGSISAMGINFLAARFIVFRPQARAEPS